VKLYPHQVTGVDWLAPKTRAGLLDEAGLGKTITALVAAERAGVGTILVLAPTVVAWNWSREARRWTSRPVHVVSASSEQPRRVEDDAVVIVTHGLVIRGPVFDWITARQWGLAVLDEAHYFRNESAQRTRAFYGTGGIVHHADRVWLLTGTIMPNNAGELWPHLRGLWPDRCHHSYESFRELFCVTEWSVLRKDFKIVGNKNLPMLKTLLAGLFLRRLKKDHLDLPPIRWETVVLPFADDEPLLTHLDDEMQKRLTAGTPVLELLKQEEFARYRRLCGIAKVKPTVELLEQDALPKVVVFAHHLDVLDGLERGLGPDNCVKLTGAVSAHERKRMVDLFQTDPTLTYALCQITAGGVGITLTAASEVVFVEQSFVPGDNSQAADRCHRIGQEAPVRVRALALADSIDELVVETITRKTRDIREVEDSLEKT
jgi:SWI/SNF-related matrix-associated actin-dependent regulator 1 of chromatin subfamily A